MAILRSKDVAKLSQKERDEKMKELKMQLVKAHVTANRTNAKTKEIKRTLARLHTFNKSTTGALKTK